MISRIALVTALFVVLLVYFVFGVGWYAPAQLIVRGTAPDRRADLGVSWDSGSGFNSYESQRFFIKMVAAEGDARHWISIRALGEKQPDSRGTAVEISAVSLDGQNLDLSRIVPQSALKNRSVLHLSGKGGAVDFEAEASRHIRIDLPTGNHFGKVEVTVDGSVVVRDLYQPGSDKVVQHLDYWIMGPDGRFAVTMDMPRYAVKDLAIMNRTPGSPVFLSSVIVKADRGIREFVVDGSAPLSRVSFADMNQDLKRYLSPSQLLFEILFAALTTWMVTASYGLLQRCGSLKAVFLERGRPLFWLFFVGSAGIYSLWLAAFWPGIMSVDSLKVWRAAMLPGVLINDHPMLNVVLYMYLMHLWNNVAVVPITQILLLSLLIASFFYSFSRRGVSLAILVPCFLLVACSIPVGLYSIVLWKDIPFALLVVFWGLTLADMYWKKKQGLPVASKQKIWALILLYPALALIRHNGIPYLIIIPAFILLLHLADIRRLLVVFIAVFILVAGGLIVVQSMTSIRQSHYLVDQGKNYLKKFVNRPIMNELQRTAQQYWGVFNVNQTRSGWDLWHFYLHDRSAYNFLKKTGWNDVYPYIDGQAKFPNLHQLALKTYWQTYRKPWVYLTWNPVYMSALYLLVVVLFRRLPLSAIFSGFILTQVAVLLLFINVLNWRYYYFFYLGAYFLVPLIFLDMKAWFERRAGGITHAL